jgi:UDP-glucose 4-epimerase
MQWPDDRSLSRSLQIGKVTALYCWILGAGASPPAAFGVSPKASTKSKSSSKAELGGFLSQSAGRRLERPTAALPNAWFRLTTNFALSRSPGWTNLLLVNVFVTGGAGYIGSVCVEELLDAGHEVTVYDNLTEGHRSAVDNRAVFIQARLSDVDNIHEAVRDAKPEAILHFAANALVGESMTNPSKYFRNNVCNGLKLLDAAVASGVKKFVFSSTCATYGPPERVPMTEDLPQRPINPYGESKLMFEKMLQWYERIHGLEFVAFRYFNAAGASERFGEHHRIETHLIPNVLRVALGQAASCEIYGTDYPTPDGTCIRDYIHIIDLAQAHILALQPGRKGFYNLGNGDGYSVRQVIDICAKISGQKIPTVEKPRRPGDPPKLVASAQKAISELGWKPEYPKLEQIVSDAWRWHKAHPSGYAD